MARFLDANIFLRHLRNDKQTEAYTYDTDFDAVPTITRIEP